MPLSLITLLERRFGDPTGGVSRRDLLKSSLAAGAGLLLSQSIGNSARRAAGKTVIIVGAGLGGLSAAHELKAAGYEVILVEPNHRLGGRVYTLDRFIKGKTVEAGGEMIGANHPLWTAYADRFDLTLIEIKYDIDAESPIVVGGQRLDAAAAKTLWTEIREALSSINDDAAPIDPYEPWTSPQAADLDRRNTARWIDRLRVSDLCKKCMSIQLTAINGMIPAWQSYLGNLAMVKGGGLENYWTQTDFYHCLGGNQQLPEELADEIGAQHFILGSPATAIQVTDDGAEVTLADGRLLQGDDVVVAVPSSVWGRIDFEPQLPVFLVPQMGNNTKFLSAVKKRFWEPQNLSPRSLTDGPINLTWEDTNSQPGDERSCLTAYAGGPQADQAMNDAPEERQQKYLAELEKLYPGFQQNFVAAQFVNWLKDPLARGSYSFPAPGQVTTIGPTLQTGLGRLHFAGEHCCYAFIGYMEGALQSGARLAKRLAIRDGLVKA